MASSDFSAISSLFANGVRQPRDFFSSVGPTLSELSFGLLGSSFEPERDVVDLAGKVVFVTGGKPPLTLAGQSTDRLGLQATQA